MILFRPQFDVYLLLIMASPPTDFTQPSPSFIFFTTFFPPHTLSTSLSLMCLTNKYILFPQNMQLKLTRFLSTWNKTVLPQNTTAWVLYALCSYYKLQLHFKANLKYSFYLTIKCNLLFG